MFEKLDINLSGTQITDEKHNSLGSDYYSLDHDTFFGGTDFDIYTATAGGGTHLIEGTHYSLHDEDTVLTADAGKTVYTTVKIIDPTYQTGDLYFTYKTVGDYPQAVDINNVLTADLFQPKAWNKSLFAYAGTQLASGTATTDTQNKLVDTGASFSGTISAGDIVHNSTDKTWATVLVVESDTSLRLDWDAFPDGNEGYTIYDEPSVPTNHIELTGELLDGDGAKAADTNTANHLLDADGTDWTTIMSVGDWAMNLSTGLVAKITAVAAHDLTLQWDCFPNGNEPYMLWADTIEIDDADSPIDNAIIPEMNISGRFVRPGMTAEVVREDMIQRYLLGDGTNNLILTGSGTRSSSTGAAGYRKGDGYNGAGDGSIASPMTDDVSGTPRTGNETRPRNLSMVMIMRIK